MDVTIKTVINGMTFDGATTDALIIFRSDSRYLIDGMTKWRK